MIKARIVKVSEAINNHDRAGVGYNGRSLFKCDVCWTCKYFNVQISSCVFSYQDALEKFGPEESYDKEYYILPIPIKDPSYYRCSAWFGKEKDDQEISQTA